MKRYGFLVILLTSFVASACGMIVNAPDVFPINYDAGDDAGVASGVDAGRDAHAVDTGPGGGDSSTDARTDATLGDAASDGAVDARPDATLWDAGSDTSESLPDANRNDATFDATIPDATSYDAASSDGMSVDGSVRDAAPSDAVADTCGSRLAAVFSQPITMTRWGGLDLSNGGAAVNVPGSGGLTIPGTALASCATWFEPTVLSPDAAPLSPGYREYDFGTQSGVFYPFALAANMESQVIYEVSVGPGYTGTMTFTSRPDGGYGAHSYTIGVGTLSFDGGVPIGAGYVKRDGVDFAADWNFVFPDSGGFQASAWVNELYDGLMATFAPSSPAVSECLSTPTTSYVGVLIAQNQRSCDVTTGSFAPGESVSVLRINPLGLNLYFNSYSNQAVAINRRWNGGTADCATQQANLERMDFGAIGNQTLGGLSLFTKVSNPLGLTATESNTIECNGLPSTAIDQGYEAISWGQNGEVSMEYFPDSGLDYRVYANVGYRTPLQLYDNTGNEYSLMVGSPATVNGSQYVIDWPDAGTPVAATTLSNAACSVTDIDCVDAGDCTVSYRGGDMVLGFICQGPVPAVQYGIVFGAKTSTVSHLFAENPFAK